MKKYNFNDNFELLYLRHEYLSKIKDPESLDIEKYFGISCITARKMFDKHKSKFERVGFNADDIISVSNVYLIGYVGLYSFEHNEELFQRYLAKHINRFGEDSYPSEKEIERVERNNLINFLRQKLSHCATVCSRKSRNIFVGKDFRGFFAETDESKPASDELIAKHYKKYGYRKVSSKEFKEAQEKARENGISDLFDTSGRRIFEIKIKSNGISKEDYQDISNFNKSIFYQDPQTVLETIESDNRLKEYEDIYNKLDSTAKYKKLSVFVRKNKDNKLYKEEIKIARKKMKEIRDTEKEYAALFEEINEKTNKM